MGGAGCSISSNSDCGVHTDTSRGNMISCSFVSLIYLRKWWLHGFAVFDIHCSLELRLLLSALERLLFLTWKAPSPTIWLNANQQSGGENQRRTKDEER